MDGVCVAGGMNMSLESLTVKFQEGNSCVKA